ncbi:MAG: apolipoprotein N-acyltransferase [Phycisphaerales bacterium JB039]
MRLQTQGPDEAPSLVRLWLWPLAAGLLYSAATALAFAPFGFWGFALLSPAPLLWAGWSAGSLPRPARSKGLRRLRALARSPVLAAWLGASAGALPLWLFEQQWTIDVTRLGYLPMCVTLAMLVGLCPAALGLIRRGLGPGALAWAGPIAWAGVEVFRGEVFFTGYPWLLAAHPLIDAPLGPGLAALVGAYGAGALAVAPAAILLAGGGRRRRVAGAAAALGVLAGVGVLGAALRPAPDDRSIRVAVVQTNVPQDNKIGWRIEDRVRDLERFIELSRRAAEAEPDLIIWPETMFPGMTLEPAALAAARSAELGQDSSLPDRPFVPVTWFADELLALQSELGIPMLVGAIGLEDLRTEPVEFGAQFNSAYVLARGAVAGPRYDKIHLTPFGEVMPYISAIPGLQRLLLDLAATSMPFTLQAGSSERPLELPLSGGMIRAATPICFEAASAPTCRRISAQPRADLLINLTNDGWFGDFDAARIQAEQIARWRAAELAIPLVRAANTGASGAFDHRGRALPWRYHSTTGTGRLRTSGVLIVETPLAPDRATPFARGGWIAGWLLLAATGALLAWGLLAGRRSSNQDAIADEV